MDHLHGLQSIGVNTQLERANLAKAAMWIWLEKAAWGTWWGTVRALCQGRTTGRLPLETGQPTQSVSHQSIHVQRAVCFEE